MSAVLSAANVDPARWPNAPSRSTSRLVGPSVFVRPLFLLLCSVRLRPSRPSRRRPRLRSARRSQARLRQRQQQSAFDRKEPTGTAAHAVVGPAVSHSNGRGGGSGSSQSSRKKVPAATAAATQNGKRAVEASSAAAASSAAPSSAAVNGGGKVALSTVAIRNSRGATITIGRPSCTPPQQKGTYATQSASRPLMRVLCFSCSPCVLCDMWRWAALWRRCGVSALGIADPSLHYLHMLARDPLFDHVQHQTK